MVDLDPLKFAARSSSWRKQPDLIALLVGSMEILALNEVSASNSSYSKR